MSDQAETLQLVAVEMGFAMGRMVHVGQKFPFRKFDASGKERKLPKWARLATDPAAVKKAAAWNGDLRPVDAQKASKNKTGELKASA